MIVSSSAATNGREARGIIFSFFGSFFVSLCSKKIGIKNYRILQISHYYQHFVLFLNRKYALLSHRFQNFFIILALMVNPPNGILLGNALPDAVQVDMISSPDLSPTYPITTTVFHQCLKHSSNTEVQINSINSSQFSTLVRTRDDDPINGTSSTVVFNGFVFEDIFDIVCVQGGDSGDTIEVGK